MEEGGPSPSCDDVLFKAKYDHFIPGPHWPHKMGNQACKRKTQLRRFNGVLFNGQLMIILSLDHTGLTKMGNQACKRKTQLRRFNGVLFMANYDKLVKAQKSLRPGQFMIIFAFNYEILAYFSPVRALGDAISASQRTGRFSEKKKKKNFVFLSLFLGDICNASQRVREALQTVRYIKLALEGHLAFMIFLISCSFHCFVNNETVQSLCLYIDNLSKNLVLPNLAFQGPQYTFNAFKKHAVLLI